MKTIEIDIDDWPRCAKCDMPVEQFSGTDDGTALTFVAMCHGEVQSATIPDSTWDIETYFDMEEAFRDNEEGDDNDRTTLDG